MNDLSQSQTSSATPSTRKRAQPDDGFDEEGKVKVPRGLAESTYAVDATTAAASQLINSISTLRSTTMDQQAAHPRRDVKVLAQESRPFVKHEASTDGAGPIIEHPVDEQAARIEKLLGEHARLKANRDHKANIIRALMHQGRAWQQHYDAREQRSAATVQQLRNGNDNLRRQVQLATVDRQFLLQQNTQLSAIVARNGRAVGAFNAAMNQV